MLIVPASNVASADDVHGAGRVVLGGFEPVDGTQEFAVPDGTPTDEASVVIWSRPYGLIFAVAPLGGPAE